LSQRHYRSIFIAVIVLLTSLPLFATSLCGTGQTGAPLFCGTLSKISAGGTLTSAPSGYRLDICDSFPCGGHAYTAFTDASGNWETQNAVNGCMYGVNNQNWYIFVSSLEGWGSRDYPVQTIYANDTCGLAHINVRVPPAPNRPQPLGPANNSELYQTDVYLIWQNSIDDARNDPNWTVSYDLYIKSWPWGTTEPAYPSPLHPQCAPGPTCSYHLFNMPGGMNYKWKVDAHLDVTASIVNPVVRPIIFSSNGSYFMFTTGAGRIPGCCR